MKKIVVLITVLAMLAGCTAPAPEPSKGNTKIRIGLSIPTVQEERWVRDRDEIVSYCEQQGVEVLVQSANGDDDLQISQCRNLLSQGISALIIIPNNTDAMAGIVEEAHQAGVKVVSLDRMIADVDVDYYVTYDSFIIGVLQAEYILSQIDSGNFMIIGGSQVDPNAVLMREGQLSVLQPKIDSGEIKIVSDEWAHNWSPDDAARFTQDALDYTGGDIDAIVASNDGCAGAAIQVLAEYGLAGDIPVSGLDADISACQRIVEGTQSMTVYRDLALQNRVASDIAMVIARGEEITSEKIPEIAMATEIENGRFTVPSIVFSDESLMYIVDENNMHMMEVEGWLELEDIYKNVEQDA